MTLVKLLLAVSPFFILVPLTSILLRYRYFTPALKWFAGYILLCAFTGFVSYALWCLKKNNLWLLPVQTTAELPLILIGFRLGIGNYKHAFHFYGLLAGFMSFSILYSLVPDSICHFNSLVQNISSVLIISGAVRFFFHVQREMKTENIFRSPMFWIASATLLYYAGTLFLFSLGNIIIRKPLQATISFWLFNAFLAALQYTLIAIGFWRSKTT